MCVYGCYGDAALEAQRSLRGMPSRIARTATVAAGRSSMSAKSSAQNGLVQPHVLYSFLETASEGFSVCESDSESLAHEKQYQTELRKRIHNHEELVSQFVGEAEEDSIEEDSLEGEATSDEEGAQRPSRSSSGKENNSGASSKEEPVDRYSELRYNPNWRKSREGVGLIALPKSDEEEDEISPVSSVLLHSSQLQLKSRNQEHQERPYNVPSVPGLLWGQALSMSNGSWRLPNSEEQTLVARSFDRNSSINSDCSSTLSKELKQRPQKDIVGRNKLTLGLPTEQKNSYLQLHGKKQKEHHQGEAQQCQTPDTGSTSPALSLEENPLNGNAIQHSLGAPVELRSHHGGCHNVLEFENIDGNSSSYTLVSGLEKKNRFLLHHKLHLNPSTTLLCPSVANSSKQEERQLPTEPAYAIGQNGKQNSMSLTSDQKLLQLNSCQAFPGFHLPCMSETKRKYQHNPENIFGFLHQSRCTVSQPQTLTRHGDLCAFAGRRSFPCANHGSDQTPVNSDFSSWNLKRSRRKTIPSGSYVSGNSELSQLSAHNQIRSPSPATRLIQAAEQHHRELSQLADEHLSGPDFTAMFPSLVQRGESDSQLNTESCEESHPILSRSNSEGYLLQIGKQKEKEIRKGCRTKGYMVMDVKLGGLGPDCETIKEKSEKIKQKKEYAKQVKEHNMKIISSARKPQPKPENKSAMARQKALEYAKTIPKPKLYVSKPSEQEPKEGKNLAHTLNGENLPPISSLESLQNRHEKEKKVVAAFKTLHIV